MARNFSKPESGETFGRLTVRNCYLKDFGTYRKTVAECVCSCGKASTVTVSLLRRGKTLSCGCLQRERASEANKSHGKSKTPLFRKWHRMIARCLYPSTKDWERYGGRGIKVCDDWIESFEAFESWCLDHGYMPHLELDRIDNDGNYCPENCRFVTKTENANNTRTNRRITIDGVTKTISQWSREVGISASVISNRLKRGWSEIEAVTTPLVKRK